MENIIDKIKLESTGEIYELVGKKPSELEILASAIDSLTQKLNELSVKVDRVYYDRFPDEKPSGSGSGSGSGVVPEP